jgi:hypothetical protein
MAAKNGKGGVGAGLALAGAIAGAALGAYFLYGPEGKKNKRKVQGWMLKAKGEVLEQVEKAKELDKEAYETIVTKVADRYGKLKNVDMREVALLVAELRSHWNKVKRDWNEASAPKPKKAKAVVKRTKTVKVKKEESK